jgi:hypothetical protein
MSSKKTNKAKATEETVVETPVVETTEEVVTEAPVETPVTEGIEETPVVEEQPVTEEAPAEEAPATEGIEVAPTIVTMTRSANDKYDTDLGDEDEKPSTDPETEEEEVEDEKETTKEITDRAVMNKYLQKVYDVKFSFSQASKRFAVNRKMTLLAMYDMFVKNRVAFVGLKSQDDYKEIHDFMTKYTVIYKYMTVSAAAKEQFLTKLRAATDYVVMSSK